MKTYELLLILPGTLDEGEAEAKINEVKAMMTEFAPDAVLHNLGKNRLAYPVKHIRYGYFYIMIFSVETEPLKKIQDKLALSRELLRAEISVSGKKSSGEQKINYFGEGHYIRPDSIKPERDRKYSRGESAMGEGEKARLTREEVVAEPIVVTEEKKSQAEEQKPTVDLKEIDKKLDEILSDDGIMSGV